MATKEQDATPMCANGCGFFGSVATKIFCSQCYKKQKTAAVVAPGLTEKEKHVMKTAAAVAPGPAEKERHVMKTAAVTEKVDAALGLAEEEKHEGSSGSAAVAEKIVDAAPAEKESGSAETTEKHEAAAAPVMCANGCNFFGSAATKNMCSSCYRDFLKDAHAAPATAEKIEVAPEQPAPPEISAATPSAPASKVAPNRCAGCKRKVGLLGFSCRCGGTFCLAHRYPDKHACGFDFKTADREQIAKKNPLVVAPKLNKI